MDNYEEYEKLTPDEKAAIDELLPALRGLAKLSEDGDTSLVGYIQSFGEECRLWMQLIREEKLTDKGINQDG